MKGTLLILDDDKVFCGMLARSFDKEYGVVHFFNPLEAVQYINEKHVDVVLTDLNMPEMDGLDVLKAVKRSSLDTDVIVMTAFAQVDSAVEAMRRGAYDYIVKPFTTDELAVHLTRVFEKRRLVDENLNLREFVEVRWRPENMIGESEEMQAVYRFIERVSQVDATTLITGESGTGKEVVARALHCAGGSKERRFVSVNCSSIPETLLESELFGHAKGAFSGAAGDRKGLFEYADGGTIFLDEIADIPLAVQAKLLRVLQEQSFRPLGSTDEVSVAVRVICATNRDMNELIREKKFREDLYYRINVIAVHLPALRDRRGDIPLLISHFLKGRKKIHPRSVSILSRYSFPGNVRELKNLMESLVALTDADTIKPDDLPPEIMSKVCFFCAEGDELSYNEARKKILDEFNRSIIFRTLLKHDGNVTKAAKELNLDRANFQRLMRTYQTPSKEFKDISSAD
jgi:two-component system response regulator AtoC